VVVVVQTVLLAVVLYQMLPVLSTVMVPVMVLVVHVLELVVIVKHQIVNVLDQIVVVVAPLALLGQVDVLAPMTTAVLDTLHHVLVLVANVTCLSMVPIVVLLELVLNVITMLVLPLDTIWDHK